MNNGTINLTPMLGANENVDAKIEWSVAPISKHKAKITAKLYYKITNINPLVKYGGGSFFITIAGDRSSATKGEITIAENEWFLAFEASTTISNSLYNDPAKVLITGGGGLLYPTASLPDVSGYAEFDRHDGETLIDSLSCSTAYFDGDIACKYTTYDNRLFVKCDIELIIGDSSTAVTTTFLGREYIGDKDSEQNTKQVNLSKEELATIYNKLPTSTSGKLRFTFVSYSDSDYSKQVGSNHYKEIILSIPSNDFTQPTATMMLSPYSNLTAPFNGMYIMEKSKVSATFTDVEGKHGATIQSIKMTMLGKDYSDPYISDYIPYDGSIVIKGIITDSRGISRTYTETINALPYSIPLVVSASSNDKIICERCDEDGNLSDSGTYLKIEAKRRFSKVVYNGVQTNFCQIRYRYKADGESYSSWTTILDANSASDEVSTGALLSGALNTTKSYVVQIGVLDSLGTTDNVTIFISTAKAYIHKAASRNSLGVGTYVEDDEVDTIAIGEGMKVVFRGDEWKSLGLIKEVGDSTINIGRHGSTGCYYKVCDGGKHVYVAFNVAFSFANDALLVNDVLIPEAYRPARNVHAICAVDGRSIARIHVDNEGRIYIDWVQNLASAAETTSATIKWIDGYIDYWIEQED